MSKRPVDDLSGQEVAGLVQGRRLKRRPELKGHPK